MTFKYHDSPLYFRAARDAAQIEREGDYQRAAKVWIKALRLSRSVDNQLWCERRSDFCLSQIPREKYKEVAV